MLGSYTHSQQPCSKAQQVSLSNCKPSNPQGTVLAHLPQQQLICLQTYVDEYQDFKHGQNSLPVAKHRSGLRTHMVKL